MIKGGYKREIYVAKRAELGRFGVKVSFYGRLRVFWVNLREHKWL
jgi:hypothetical protein